MNNPTFAQLHDAQSKLIYSLIVAGKSADFADKALAKLYMVFERELGVNNGERLLPFVMLERLFKAEKVEACLREARTGNYRKLFNALLRLTHSHLNLFTVLPWALEEIPGIGPKTSRFFIMWLRPEERYAALDTHVLRWLRERYPNAPKSTPQNPKVYKHWEEVFIFKANKMGLTPRQLDSRIWEAGAGRTQRTPLPEPL